MDHDLELIELNLILTGCCDTAFMWSNDDWPKYCPLCGKKTPEIQRWIVASGIYKYVRESK